MATDHHGCGARLDGGHEIVERGLIDLKLN